MPAIQALHVVHHTCSRHHTNGTSSTCTSCGSTQRARDQSDSHATCKGAKATQHWRASVFVLIDQCLSSGANTFSHPCGCAAQRAALMLQRKMGPMHSASCRQHPRTKNHHFCTLDQRLLSKCRCFRASALASQAHDSIRLYILTIQTIMTGHSASIGERV